MAARKQSLMPAAASGKRDMLLPCHAILEAGGWRLEPMIR
jgi:hypothetical protein